MTQLDGAPRHPPLGPSLLGVLEVELEGVLQATFAARQDVLDARGRDADPALLDSAEITLQGCLATMQILLGLLRAVPGKGARWTVSLDRVSEAFLVLRVSGEVLYMNAAVTRLVKRDHRAVVHTTFEEREWCDRAQMRRHLDEAFERGRAIDTFDVLRGDGVRVDMTFRTERIEIAGDDAFLMMSHVSPEPS